MMMKSVFWWRKPEYPEETTDLRQVTDETFSHIFLYTAGLFPVRGLNLGRSGVHEAKCSPSYRGPGREGRVILRSLIYALGHFIITVHFGVPKVVSSIKIKYFTDKFKFCVF